MRAHYSARPALRLFEVAVGDENVFRTHISTTGPPLRLCLMRRLRAQCLMRFAP